MTFSKQSERTALLLAGLHGLGGALLYGLAVREHSLAIRALCIVHATGTCVSLLAWVYAALIRLAGEEDQSREQLEGDRGKLFDQGAGAGERQRSLQQFERFGTSGAAMVLVLLEGTLAWLLAGLLGRAPTAAAPLGLGTASGLVILAFVFFLAGKYAAALAGGGEDRQGTLTAPAGISLLAAGLLLASGLAHLLVYAFRDVESVWLGQVDAYLAWALIGVVAALVLERLIGIVLSIYRPQRPGERRVPAYESRLTGLLVRPGGFIQNISEMLDYQFGFQISETWFVRLVTRAVLPLCILQALILLLLSCQVFVNPGERVLKEHWGRPIPETLPPGYHTKWPWPVERVYRFKSDRLRQFTIGIGSDPSGVQTPTQFWSDLSPDVPVFVAASTVENVVPGAGRSGPGTLAAPSATLLAAEIKVLYYLKDIRRFEYEHVHAVDMLKALARREALRTFASHDGFALLEEDRQRLATGLSQSLQSQADDLGLGLAIASVGVGRLQPPAGVVTAFHEVLAQRQQRETVRLQAEQYRHQSVPAAEAEARQLRSLAAAYRAQRVDSSRAFAEVFALQGQLFRDHRQLFTVFAYLDRLERALKGVRKIAVATDLEDQVFSIDFKESLQPELLDFSSPKPGE